MRSVIVGNTAFDGNILVEEQPVRGDFILSKVTDKGKPMAGVEFEIISTVDGIKESHTFRTGADGKYSSKTDENMWFGKKSDGSETPKDKSQGALPYGTYVIREKSAEANKGYQIQPEMTISITSNGQIAVVKDANVTGDDYNRDAGTGNVNIRISCGDEIKACSGRFGNNHQRHSKLELSEGRYQVHTCRKTCCC
jgi:hypothetical protein